MQINRCVTVLLFYLFTPLNFVLANVPFLDAGYAKTKNGIASLYLIDPILLKKYLPDDLALKAPLIEGRYPVIATYSYLYDSFYRYGIFHLPSFTEYDEIIFYIPQVSHQGKLKTYFSNIYLNSRAAFWSGNLYYSMNKIFSTFKKSRDIIEVVSEDNDILEFPLIGETIRGNIPNILKSYLNEISTRGAVSINLNQACSSFKIYWEDIRFSSEEGFKGNSRLVITDRENFDFFNQLDYQGSLYIDYQYYISYPNFCGLNGKKYPR